MRRMLLVFVGLYSILVVAASHSSDECRVKQLDSCTSSVLSLLPLGILLGCRAMAVMLTPYCILPPLSHCVQRVICQWDVSRMWRALTDSVDEALSGNRMDPPVSKDSKRCTSPPTDPRLRRPTTCKNHGIRHSLPHLRANVSVEVERCRLRLIYRDIKSPTRGQPGWLIGSVIRGTGK